MNALTALEEVENHSRVSSSTLQLPIYSSINFQIDFHYRSSGPERQSSFVDRLLFSEVRYRYRKMIDYAQCSSVMKNISLLVVFCESAQGMKQMNKTHHLPKNETIGTRKS